MSDSPLGRLAIVTEAECIDSDVTGQSRYRTMRGIVRMIPATERM
jgi:hypothetical protein